MIYGKNLVTAPVLLPLTLGRVKNHLKLDDDLTADDAKISGLIRTATSLVETITNRALITQTWDFYYDHFPCDRFLEVPKPKLQSITSISYVDTAGDTQTWSSSLYDVDIRQTPGRIAPAYSEIWPTIRCEMNAVTVRAVVGYGANPGDVPEDIRDAMLLIIGHLYENRQATLVGVSISDLPMGVESLLADHRVITF